LRTSGIISIALNAMLSSVSERQLANSGGSTGMQLCSQPSTCHLPSKKCQWAAGARLEATNLQLPECADAARDPAQIVVV
jgi:hypothetical protein